VTEFFNNIKLVILATIEIVNVFWPVLVILFGMLLLESVVQWVDKGPNV